MLEKAVQNNILSSQIWLTYISSHKKHTDAILFIFSCGWSGTILRPCASKLCMFDEDTMRPEDSKTALVTMNKIEGQGISYRFKSLDGRRTLNLSPGLLQN